MFYGCTNLTFAPELRATTLVGDCYGYMFYGCTNLTSAPELPATTLVEGCYYYMFYGCTNLTFAPELRATTLAERCYSKMFNGCTKLSTVTMLAPSTQITGKITEWLYKAGTVASSRTLKVQDANAYNALVNTGFHPENWKIGVEGTTVVDENDKEINIE